jgi:DNA-binding CsgD family transcriptional regulator
MNQVVGQIAQCESLPQLWRLMIAYFRERGFAGVCYMAFGATEPGSASGTAVQAVQHGFNPAAAEAYLRSDFARLDIVPRLSLAQGRPIRWSDAWATADTSGEERRFFGLMQAAELGDGFGLPCYGPQGRNAFVGIGAMTEEARTDELSIREMHIMAQAAHLQLCALTLSEATLDRGLSAREKEILEWVARGKSNGVIAEILNISAGTVDTYLRRLYEKLGVSDRTSAAVRGIGMGLIAG